MAGRRTIRNSSPYKLVIQRFGGDALEKFLRGCRHCTRNEGACEVFTKLRDSIVDDTLRWEEGWVRLDKEGPVCLRRRAKEGPHE